MLLRKLFGPTGVLIVIEFVFVVQLVAPIRPFSGALPDFLRAILFGSGEFVAVILVER